MLTQLFEKKKTVLCFSFSCCLFCILYFSLPGKKCLGVRTELEHVFVWVPPEKQTPETIISAQIVLLKVHGALKGEWRKYTGKRRQQVIKHA